MMIYLLTSIGLSPGGSSTVHIYTQTIHRTIQNKKYIETQQLEECRPCPDLASYTLAFALQPRKKHGKTSVRVAASKNKQTKISIKLGCHPVAVVQYTFTHKQYIERYKTNNT